MRYPYFSQPAGSRAGGRSILLIAVSTDPEWELITENGQHPTETTPQPPEGAAESNQERPSLLEPPSLLNAFGGGGSTCNLDRDGFGGSTCSLRHEGEKKQKKEKGRLSKFQSRLQPYMMRSTPSLLVIPPEDENEEGKFSKSGGSTWFRPKPSDENGQFLDIPGLAASKGMFSESTPSLQVDPPDEKNENQGFFRRRGSWGGISLKPNSTDEKAGKLSRGMLSGSMRSLAQSLSGRIASASDVSKEDENEEGKFSKSGGSTWWLPNPDRGTTGQATSDYPGLPAREKGSRVWTLNNQWDCSDATDLETLFSLVEQTLEETKPEPGYQHIQDLSTLLSTKTCVLDPKCLLDPDDIPYWQDPYFQFFSALRNALSQSTPTLDSIETERFKRSFIGKLKAETSSLKRVEQLRLLEKLEPCMEAAGGYVQDVCPTEEAPLDSPYRFPKEWGAWFK